MPYLGLEVKARNKGETNSPSPRRHNRIICAINYHRDATCQKQTDVKQTFLPYHEPDLCHDYILKDPEYIDCFYFKFLCHYVLKQVPVKQPHH